MRTQATTAPGALQGATSATVNDLENRIVTQTVATIIDTSGRRTLNAELERRGLIGWQCRLVRYSETSSRGGQRDVCTLDPRIGLTAQGARRRAERVARRHPAWAALLEPGRRV